uniref:Uncharacterized protein n=1 Tax=Anolis carolinensis TaxID=28377 RepID=A0A803T4K7_ANOCA
VESGPGRRGAYRAAKAGSPFDLCCFLQQPQVLARLLSAVSQDSGQAGAVRNCESWSPKHPEGRNLPHA